MHRPLTLQVLCVHGSLRVLEVAGSSIQVTDYQAGGLSRGLCVPGCGGKVADVHRVSYAIELRRAAASSAQRKRQ